MKDVFYKIADFFKRQIQPNDRARQAEGEPDQRIGEDAAHKKGKTAQGGKIEGGPQYGKNGHKHPLPALPQRQPQQKKRQPRDQPEQKIGDCRDGT